jgi:hypothetical protein
VAEEALRNQLRNLEETIGDLVRLAKSLPEGSFRDSFFDEIGARDSIASSMKLVSECWIFFDACLYWFFEITG